MGLGKGTHVFVAILEEEHDAGLKWPFVGYTAKVIPFNATNNRNVGRNQLVEWHIELFKSFLFSYCFAIF